MTNDVTLPVIIISKGRPEFLATTLGALGAAYHALPGKSMGCLKLKVEVILDQDVCDEVERSSMSSENLISNMMMHYANRYYDASLLVTRKDRYTSLASARSKVLRKYYDMEGVNYVLMLDDDITMLPQTLEAIYAEMMTNPDVLCCTAPFVDPSNERGYLDWNPNSTFTNVESYEAVWPGAMGHAYQRYYSTQLIPYCTTMGLWNLKALHDTGLLDFWDAYPVGKRGYDYIGTKEAVKLGSRILLTSEYQTRHIGFNHLWTRSSDDGYFTETTFPTLSEGYGFLEGKLKLEPKGHTDMGFEKVKMIVDSNWPGRDLIKITKAEANERIRKGLKQLSPGVSNMFCDPHSKNVVRSSPVARKATGTVIPFSGGVESVTAALLYPKADLLYVEGLDEIKNSLGHDLHEPILYLLCKSLGYKTVSESETYVGPEDKDVIYPDYQEGLEEYYIDAMLGAIGMDRISPTRMSKKHHLVSNLVAMHVAFSSCDHKHKTWCGECFKCYQIKTMIYLDGRHDDRIPNNFNSSDIHRWLNEQALFRTERIDPFYGDCMLLDMAERDSPKTIDDRWKDV